MTTLTEKYSFNFEKVSQKEKEPETVTEIYEINNINKLRKDGQGNFILDIDIRVPFNVVTNTSVTGPNVSNVYYNSNNGWILFEENSTKDLMKQLGKYLRIFFKSEPQIGDIVQIIYQGYNDQVSTPQEQTEQTELYYNEMMANKTIKQNTTPDMLSAYADLARGFADAIYEVNSITENIQDIDAHKKDCNGNYIIEINMGKRYDSIDNISFECSDNPTVDYIINDLTVPFEKVKTILPRLVYTGPILRFNFTSKKELDDNIIKINYTGYYLNRENGEQLKNNIIIAEPFVYKNGTVTLL